MYGLSGTAKIFGVSRSLAGRMQPCSRIWESSCLVNAKTAIE